MKRREISSNFRNMLLLIAAVFFTGCYWTPDNSQEASLAIEVDMATRSGISPQEVGEIDEPSGALIAFVIEESLLQDDPAELERLFTEMEETDPDSEIDFRDFETYEEYIEYLWDFTFEVTYPAARLQMRFIDFGEGSSGASTFTGLNSTSYLVMVIASGFDDENEMEGDAIGFTTTTVRAGETRRVSLNLDDNWSSFDQFLVDRYGFEPEPVTIEIWGIDSADWYFEFLPADAVSFPDGWTWDISPGDFQNWYDEVSEISFDQTGTILSESDNRLPLPESDVEPTHTIEGVVPGSTWRILITRWPDRNETPSGNTLTGTSEHVLYSSPITIDFGADLDLDKMSDFAMTTIGS